jgi:hypothetical protein
MDQLLAPYPPQAPIKDPYPGMVILVQNDDLYQFQEVVDIKDGQAVMAPYLRGLKGSQKTYLKSNKGNAYLVLEDVPLSIFLSLPETTLVMATTYGHYDPVTVGRFKSELLDEYHLVSEETIPQ